MKPNHKCFAAAMVALALLPTYAGGEILAMVNYESKSPDSLKVLKNPVAPQARKEGIAIIDVDPKSKGFGNSVQDLPLPADQKRWFLTCMGSQAMIILGDAGETITVAKASTGEVMGTHKVSTKASPSGEAPVEILFVPGTEPPVAYVTNMYAGTLSAATWDPAKQDFKVEQIYDVAQLKAGVPLEMYFNKKGDRFYVTTAKPGELHLFAIGKDPRNPKLVKSIPTAEGAHHVAFTKDGRYAFVQNALLNLAGMSDGSITIVDRQKNAVIGSVETLKNQGFNPNSIVLLPEWNDPAGH